MAGSLFKMSYGMKKDFFKPQYFHSFNCKIFKGQDLVFVIYHIGPVQLNRGLIIPDSVPISISRRCPILITISVSFFGVIFIGGEEYTRTIMIDYC